MQVSEVLAKVVRQQADVAALAEKRAEVLSCVEEFEAVRAECRWLSEYENDEMRYKVGHAPSWANAISCIETTYMTSDAEANGCLASDLLAFR